MSNSKVVGKILRPLPKRLYPKVIAIEERNDIDFIKVEELIGSFKKFELILKYIKKNIAPKVDN